MKKKLPVEAHSTPLIANTWPRLLALGLLAALGSSSPAWAQNLPGALGTSVVDGNNYAVYNLSLVGGFKQVRLQATASKTNSNGNGALWEFILSASDYSTNWRPYATGLTLSGFNQFIDPTQQAASARLNNNFGGQTGLLPSTSSGNYYTFNIANAQSNQSNGNSMEVLETTFNPVAIGAPTATAPAYGQPTTVTATLGGTPAAAENFYLRYSTNSYATSTVQLMTKSGTTVTGTVPGQAGGTVSYYVFSSNKTAAQLASDFSAVGLQVVYDMATLNLSTGAMYSPTALSGTYTINQNGSGATNFTSLGAAFSALSSNGVAGPVQFNVKDGQTFTENSLALASIGGASATNRITFQRDNSGGVAPLVQASTNFTPGRQDAVIKLQGADFITFDGINVSENLLNADLSTGDNQAMEYGYALFRASASDGCQNNIIRNCTVTLNRQNPNPTYGIWLANTDLTGSVLGASSASGTNSNNTLAGNTIGNCFYGIDAAGQGLADTGNQLGGDPTSTVAGNTISTVTRFGILAFNQSNLVIGRNTISFAPGNTGFMYGIVVGANTAGALVTANRVRTLKYTGSNGIGVRGISLDPGSITANITVRNNTVSDLTADGNGASTDSQLMGIGVLSGTGFNIYNNSVQLNDSRPANGFINKVSTALFVASGATGLDVRNNILSNVQSVADGATQPGTNYAVYAAGAGNPFTTIDYNLYDLRSGSTSRTMAASPQYLGHVNGADLATLAAWQAATGQDRSSMLSSGSNTAGFTSSINLAPDVALGSAYVLNGTGVQIASVTTDLTGTPRSTTVATGAPDLGAYEFTPAATPNPLDVSGPPSLGGTQTFSLNGRPLAVLTYGTTGTVPSQVVGRYYPGTNPPMPYAAGARYQNAYFLFADFNNNGSGYTYTITTYYDPALLGTIASESAQHLTLRRADGTGYNPLATMVNATARTLTSTTVLTRFDLVAVDDVAAPLPVELTTFTAQRQGLDAVLSWTTARETNNAGYEVQVSSSGNPQDFRPLGFVAPATATSQAAHSYTFRDIESGKVGLRYYRLRQVDLDGRNTYSPVRTVQFDALAASSFAATPTPFSGSLTLQLTLPQASATATLILTDALGRVVLRQDLGALPAGTSQATVAEASQLPAGVYVARLVLDSGAQTTKIVKE